MKAVAILRHAIWQVFGNMGQVMRIFGLPVLLGLVIGAVMIATMRGQPSVPALLMAGAAGMFLLLWTSVNFHRMVLLDERFDWLPTIHLREMGRCLMFLITIALLVSVAAMLVSFVLLTLIQSLGVPLTLPGLKAASLLINTLFIAVVLRLTVFLPGVAIDGLQNGAWAATRGSWSTMLGLAIATLVFDFVVSTLFGSLLRAVTVGPGLIALVALSQALLGLLSQIVGISVLTTLYGHYVQGRPLREG